MVPDFADEKTASLLSTRFPFWALLNEYIRSNGPLPPINVFKHGTQSFYSKTKGSVDGSAQARAILRSSSSSLSWEQKIVTQTLKILAINGFISYRLNVRSSLLNSEETNRDLN